jgi:hypothetical protein
MDYTNWANKYTSQWWHNEPNGGTKENCIEILGRTNGDAFSFWNDGNCDGLIWTIGYICKTVKK